MPTETNELISKSQSYKPANTLTKVSDLIADYLSFLGVSDAFVLTGGCVVHILDSLDKKVNINVVPVQHEQSASMAADSYSRVKKHLGLAIATSGPGATNLLTGVCCSYYDSVPTLILTGQVNSDQLRRNSNSRQIGFQETDVVSIFSSVTKSAVLVDDPKLILFELDKAIWNCFSGRMGPCLIDICDDVQRAELIPDTLKRFRGKPVSNIEFAEKESSSIIEKFNELTRLSSRPLLVFGAGVRNGNAINAASELIQELNVPFMLTWGAFDLFSHSHPLFAGNFGVTAGRAGNFIVQNADLIIFIGTRLDTHEIGNNRKLFAPDARKIFIDIDPSEVEKFNNSDLFIDLPIIADSKYFIEWVRSNKVLQRMNIEPGWLLFIKEAISTFTPCSEIDRQQPIQVNPYFFMEILNELIHPNTIIITDCGSNLIWTMQGIKVGPKIKRIISAWNHSPMGYALPAAIGALVAAPDSNVVCITGDGGFQINVQEAATIERMGLSLKIFILNNHGHGIIQGTQDQWLNGNHVASNFAGGLPDPDYKEICKAYGIPTVEISNNSELKEKMSMALNRQGATAIIVDMKNGSQIYPKLLAGRPIHEPSPLLSKIELKKFMRFIPENSDLRK